LRRDNSTFLNLNGLWEFQLGYVEDAPPFKKTLNQTILIPYPLESCLSGAFAYPLYSQYLWYRLLVDAPASAPAGYSSTFLHIGASDWNTTVWVNGQLAGAPHLGGYDAWRIDITPYLAARSNEIIIGVYDPSDSGSQPAGKQFVSAIESPGSVFYTPVSGVWQTVWLESVPFFHIESLKLQGDQSSLHLAVKAYPESLPGEFFGSVEFQGTWVANFSGSSDGSEILIPIPNPQLWSPTTPFLYDLTVNLRSPSSPPGTPSDTVQSYFGLRSVGKANFSSGSGKTVVRPSLNGLPMFYSGW